MYRESLLSTQLREHSARETGQACGRNAQPPTESGGGGGGAARRVSLPPA